MPLQSKTKLSLILFSCFLLGITFITDSASATLVGPGCDPSDNPDACNIAPPLNTSDDTQTKTGGLAITLDGLSTDNGLEVSNEGSGYAGYFSSSDETSSTLFVTSNPTTPTGANEAIEAYTAKGTAIKSTSNDGYGIKAYGGGAAGLQACYGNASSSSNCASLGTINYAADFDGLVDMTGSSETPTVIDDAILNITQEGTGYALNVYGQNSTETAAYFRSTDGKGITTYSVNEYGLDASSGNSYGIIASTESSSHAAVYATNDSGGSGVKGVVSTSYGVYGLAEDETYGVGVQACHGPDDGDKYNCASLSTVDYAGDFSGDVNVEGHTIVESVVYSKPQYSVFPYTSKEKKIDTAVELDIGAPSTYLAAYDHSEGYTLYDMAWDGSIMWARAYNRHPTYGSNSAFLGFNEDGKIVYNYEFGFTFDSRSIGEVVAVKNKVGFLNMYSGNCNVYILDKDDYDYDYDGDGYTDNVSISGTDCYSMTTDGERLIFPGYDTDTLYITNPNDPIDETTHELDISSYCTNPKDITYDGEYLWLTCDSGTACGGTGCIYKTQISACDPDVPSHCTLSLPRTYALEYTADVIVSDGRYIWVADNDSGDIKQLDPSDDAELEEVQELIFEDYITDMEFDGSNIWASRETDDQLLIIPINDPTSYDTESLNDVSYLAFDGTYMWTSYADSTSSDPYLATWTTDNDSFGKGNVNNQRGIIMSDAEGNMVCAYIWYNSSGILGKNYEFSFAPTGTDSFRAYCGEY